MTSGLGSATLQPGAIGVKNRYGDFGSPRELIKEFGVSGEPIAQKAAELIALAKMKREDEKLELCESD